MDTHKYDSPELRTTLGMSLKGTLLAGAALVFFLCTPSKGWATVAPLDDSGFSGYALVASPFNGNINIGNSTIKGNTGFFGFSTLNNANNDTFNGNVSYTTSSFTINGPNTTISGKEARDATLSNVFGNSNSAVEKFAQAMNQLTATQTFSSTLTNGIINSTGNVNVIDLNGGTSGSITLKGSANDIFYINVSSALNLTSIKLDGVKDDNIYWNIVNGQNSNLSGDLSGTFIDVTGAALSITSATINGAVFSNALNNMSSVTINALDGGDGTAALVPETSSYAALGVFAVLLAGSSVLRWWKSRQSGAGRLILDSASV